MTTTYNRSEIITYFELSDEQKKEVLDLYFSEESEAEEAFFVMFDHKKEGETALPLSMFMKTDKNNFTHGIYSTSAFDGYFITLSRSNDCAVIAHKYF